MLNVASNDYFLIVPNRWDAMIDCNDFCKSTFYFAWGQKNMQTTVTRRIFSFHSIIFKAFLMKLLIKNIFLSSKKISWNAYAEYVTSFWHENVIQTWFDQNVIMRNIRPLIYVPFYGALYIYLECYYFIASCKYFCLCMLYVNERVHNTNHYIIFL